MGTANRSRCWKAGVCLAIGIAVVPACLCAVSPRQWESPKARPSRAEPPLYARISVLPSGGTVLAVVLKESKPRRGWGHDVAYADLDSDGRFEPSELVRAERVGAVEWNTILFGPIRPWRSPAVGAGSSSQPWELYLRRTWPRAGMGVPSSESFSAEITAPARSGRTDWEYGLNSVIKPSVVRSKAPLVGFTGTPRLRLSVEPARVSGRVVIDLDLLIGDAGLSVARGRGLPQVAVRITDVNGQRARVQGRIDSG